MNLENFFVDYTIHIGVKNLMDLEIEMPQQFHEIFSIICGLKVYNIS
jgi:hypothetical protein